MSVQYHRVATPDVRIRGEGRASTARGWSLVDAAFFVTLWLFFLIAGRTQLLRDPGTFWHTAVGQRMLATGQFVRTDPFSFTFEGMPWIAWEWPVACTMAVLYKLGGFDTLVLATATALACLFTWLAQRFTRQGVHWLVAALAVALGLAASTHHFHPRPHIVTLLLLGWTFARLCDFEAGRRSTTSLFLLVPVFVIWANSHGGVIGGLATIGVAVAGWIVARVIGWEAPTVRRGQLVVLSTLVVACSLAVLVNPYGVQLPFLWLSVLRSSVVPTVMQEHTPLLGSMVAAPVILLGAVYTVVMTGLCSKRPRVTWLIPILWFYMTLARVRHAPLFAVTASIAMAEAFPYTRWATWLRARGSDLFRPPTPGHLQGDFRGRRVAAVPVSLVVVTLSLQCLAIPLPVLGAGWTKLDHSIWPVELLPALRRLESESPDGTPIFNEMIYGGFLILHTPGFRVFLDDRCELYGDEALLEYARAAQTNPARVERWADLYGFEFALVRNGSRFDEYLRSATQWSVAAEATAATLYQRTALRRAVTEAARLPDAMTGGTPSDTTPESRARQRRSMQ